MIVPLTEEQAIFRDSIVKFLADNYSFETRKKLLDQKQDAPDALWKGLANDLGLLAATFDEEHGGLGGGAVYTAIIMEALGPSLLLEPYVETVVLGGGVLRRSASPLAADLIGRIIAGEARLAFAHGEHQARYRLSDVLTTAARAGDGYVLNGRKAVVAGGPRADYLVVSARTGGAQRDEDGLTLFLVDRSAPGVERRDYRLIDGRPASDFSFKDVAVAANARLSDEGAAYPVIEEVVDEATVAVCAEATAVLRRALADTVEYTKNRKQFGVPLSSFQVLQHRMVDMLVQVELASAVTHMATMQIGEVSAKERARAASAAKIQVGAACQFVGQNAIQLHGGMGITDELAVSHLFKRAQVIESQFGSTDHHLARFETLSYGAAEPGKV